MKKLVILLRTVCLVSGALFAMPAHSQTLASDSAATYSAWTNGMNEGFGLQPWVLRTSGTGFQGNYIGSGGNIATSNRTWGMYANGTPTNMAVSFRGFTNSLPVNDVFRIKWLTQGIGNNDYNFAGFSLRTGNASASTADYNTGQRFAFLFRGGGQNNARIVDGSGENYLPFPTIPYGTINAGVTLEFILLPGDTYRLVIKNAAGTSTIMSVEGALAGASGDPIDSVALYASQTDGDQIFNSIQISSVSLIPPEISNVTPTNGSIYLDASTTTVSFDVTSAFSTLGTNGIKLALNGVNQTNLVFSSIANGWNATAVPTLASNLTYIGVITAQDDSGNRATNTFTFNTWTWDDPYIEAEDYNYSSGGYPTVAFPDTYGALGSPNASLLGTNGIDYLKYAAAPTNLYRPPDWTGIEVSGDGDHAGYASFGAVNYNLGWIDYGEWANYTRVMSNVTYEVHARMASLSGDPVMLMERLANPTATSSNQPRATLGTFVCPANTGGDQSYTFVQLKDFFSAPVLVRYNGTTTFRTTRIGGGYNYDYLIFVPSTATNALRPYLSTGFPFPNATGVLPDQKITFTIANRQTTVVPGSIKLFLNTTNVTTSITLSNNAAGTAVSYKSPTLLPAGTNTLLVTFDDSGSVSQTNQWQFTVANLPVLPAAYALPTNLAGLPGFAVVINKATNDAPATNFPPTIARAEAQLANLITNVLTGQPFPNEAAGPNGNGSYTETNGLNYSINGLPTGSSTFPYKSPFPYVPPSGTNNFIALSAQTYLLLAPGAYTFSVRSDDGFLLTSGPTPANTNYTLGLFDGGRGDGVPSTFSFIVVSNGLYPMQLIYDQGEFGGNIEFYSTDRETGQSVLIGNPTNALAIKAYRSLASGVVIKDPAHTGNTTTFNFQTQSGSAYQVQYNTNLATTVWLPLINVTGNGSVTNIVDPNATNAYRFYRVLTQ